MSGWWSFVLTVLGVSGLFLAGSNRREGWLFNIVAQVAWVAYSIISRQWWFLVGTVAYTAVFVRNYLRWSEA